MLIYRRKQTGAELCQAQVKLGLAKVEVFFSVSLAQPILPDLTNLG
jgi:hypothetical protein